VNHLFNERIRQIHYGYSITIQLIFRHLPLLTLLDATVSGFQLLSIWPPFWLLQRSSTVRTGRDTSANENANERDKMSLEMVK
jgi:hypothetical protein